MINSYNNSRDRSIKIAPAEVRTLNVDYLWVLLYGDSDTIRKRHEPLPNDTMLRIPVQDFVRQGPLAQLYAKELQSGSRLADFRRPVYQIKDYKGEKVKNVWYLEKIQPITTNKYRIERVIKRRRGANGKKNCLSSGLVGLRSFIRGSPSQRNTMSALIDDEFCITLSNFAI